MKSRMILAALAAIMVVGVISMIALAGPDERGNGLPKGKSYNFNVIAVPKEKENWDIDSGGNGNRIFILRTGKTQFYVQGGETFEIVDHDGTDGKVGTGGSPTDPGDEGTGLTTAGIILPYDTSDGGSWDCTVYVRLLGTAQDAPHFHWWVYGWDEDESEWADIDDFVLNRNTKFAVPTGQILDDDYQDILWEWNEKHNLRICQFRIFVNEEEE
jgi:hypothetical protein